MKSQFNNIEEWLDWQQTLHPKNIDFKIERIKSVYKKLKIKSIAKNFWDFFFIFNSPRFFGNWFK